MLAENFGEKFLYINSDETLSSFCSLHLLSNLNAIGEKRVSKFKFCSFCPDNLNIHCIWSIQYLAIWEIYYFVLFMACFVSHFCSFFFLSDVNPI